MKIEECYEKLGGNYAEVKMRLPSLALVEKFLNKFLQDQSFETLCVQTENKNCEESFRAAHTLKGICANLGFGTLFRCASELTEELRDAKEISQNAIALLQNVKNAYEKTCYAITTYFAEK